MNLPAQIQNTLSQRHFRVVVVGVALLSVVAVLQVIQSQNSQPMVPLIAPSQLCDGDIERMQFAIGKAGICACKVENGQLLVPIDCKQACLKAIAENDALPQFLRVEEVKTPSVNPFLSRSQQKQIADSAKKQLIREMLGRLPFVRNVWFEMDAASSGNTFAPPQQTAVVSVQPPENVILDSQQVATIREMVSGAVAGILSKDIVVIDLAAGYAHRSGQAANVPEVVSINERPPFEQENFYRKRIQQAVAPYGNIDVVVHVDMVEVPQATTAAYAEQVPAERTQFRTVAKPVAAIGTNGTASIYDQPAESPTPVVQASVVVPAKPKFVSRVNVLLDVPEKDALQFATASMGNSDSVKQQAIDRMGRRLVDTIRPILPASSFDKNAPFPIGIKFVPAPPVVVVTWQEKLKTIVQRHWPSAAVLVIGLMLLTMMTRSGRLEEVNEPEANEDILSIDSVQHDDGSRDSAKNHFPEVAIAQPEDYAKRNAEEKLSRIVDKDPDSAARVIESWIRDAG